MQNKNNVLLIAIGAVVIGFIIGGLCFGSFGGMRGRGGMMGNYYRNGSHMMGDGSMMMNSDMSMSSMMGSMMAGLQGKTGDAFDRAFIDEMIVHHEGAVQMAEAALKNAKHQEIKDMAKAIIAAQTKEINQMKAWRSAWYGN